MRRLLLVLAILVLPIGCGPSGLDPIGGNDNSDRSLTPTPTPSNGHHHPDGWAASTMHGPAAKLAVEDCRGCHGMNLDGVGATTGAVSCDGCHAAGWRTTCTYCHGGTDNSTGAPARDITGETAPSMLCFRSHTAHVTAGPDHVAFDCTQCHVKPVNALDSGHWFDATPAWAEVTFAAGLSSTGTYGGNASGSCANNYCHGNGRTNGSVTHTQTMNCHSCHPDMSTTATWSTMSGQHRKHLNMSGVTCYDCHGTTVKMGGTAISTPANHVDGLRETMFTTAGSTIVYSAGNKRCTGSCHGFNHSDGW